MTKTAHALQLIAEGHKTPYVAIHAGVTRGTVYDLRFRLSHPGYRRKSTAARPVVSRQSRADQACELAERMTIPQVAEKLGVTERTVRQYVQASSGDGREKVDVDRPRCRCGLSLFTDEEKRQGHCNNCLPTSATAFLGRRDEPVCNGLGW